MEAKYPVVQKPKQNKDLYQVTLLLVLLRINQHLNRLTTLWEHFSFYLSEDHTVIKRKTNKTWRCLIMIVVSEVTAH